MAKTDKSSTENPLINIDEETKKGKRISLNVVDYHKTILDLLASGSDIEHIEKLSHYFSSETIHNTIPLIKKFLSSNEPLKINDKKYDLFFMSLIPFIFTSCKELYMGKNGSTYGNHRNRINDNDLNDLPEELNIDDLNFDNINIIEGPQNLSKKQIINEIRNGIEHAHYISFPGGIYIDNPKSTDPKTHSHNFKAMIEYKFLQRFILAIQIINKKNHKIYIQLDDNILTLTLTGNKSYNEIKNKIKFGRIISDANTEDIKQTEYNPTEKEKELIEFFYKQNKKKVSSENLSYIATFLGNPQDITMYEILQIIEEWKSKQKGMNLNNLIKEIFITSVRSIEHNRTIMALSKNDETKKQFLQNLSNDIQNKKQKNGQPLLLHLPSYIVYVIEYCIKQGLEHDDKNKCRKNKKGNFQIEDQSINLMLVELSSHYTEIKKCIDMFPNRLKLQFIKSVYLNKLIPLDNEEKEHIRNALAHNRYVMLPGVEDINLKDSYDKHNDTYMREENYNLSELYEKTYREMISNK